MAHVFFADKYSEKKVTDNITESHSEKSKQFSNSHLPSKKIAHTKADSSYGNSMQGIFNLIAFITKYRIARPFRWGSLYILNGFGHFFGSQVIGRSRSTRKKVNASIKALYPHISNRSLARLTDASNKYMGSLFLDMMFNLPLTVDLPGEKFYKWVNIDQLDNAVKQGKGVIVPTFHIGEIFHVMGAIFQHPNKYYCGGVAKISNLITYEYNNRPQYSNLHVFASTDFNKLSGVLERFLKKGGILVIYHDYASPHQLRVPFILGQYPYLINTPQAYISLQRKTGAIILPAISHPDGVIGRSRIEFLNNTSIMEIANKYGNPSISKKEFQGRVSTEINKVMYPYIRSYIHVWEEINNFASIRLSDRLECVSNLTMLQFLVNIKEKMLQIIENTFEPDRNDQLLQSTIQKKFEFILSVISKPNEILRSHKIAIDLSLMNSISELNKLCIVSAREFKEKNESKVADLLMLLKEKINAIAWNN